MLNQVICVECLDSIQFERSAHDFNPPHGDSFTHKYKGDVVIAVIGLLNGVSLPPAIVC